MQKLWLSAFKSRNTVFLLLLKTLSITFYYRDRPINELNCKHFASQSAFTLENISPRERTRAQTLPGETSNSSQQSESQLWSISIIVRVTDNYSTVTAPSFGVIKMENFGERFKTF